jgi:ribonucleoside-diphosphate reductase alpha chain
LYAANGSVCGDRITLKATSLQVIKDVQVMLSSVGIYSYYTTNKSTEIEFPNGNYACKQSYDLNITSDRDVFDQLIGFIHLHKIKKLDTLLQTITPRKSAKTHDITEVINLGKHQVYDITVEAEEHSYWTGGVLVSNCGETPNRNNEPCNLGSLNLSKYFISENRSVDEDRLAEDAYTACCFLDDILDRNEFPHPDITEAAYLTRKLGLGVMGWADLLALMHIHYATEEAIHLGNRLMEIIRGNAFKASRS